jgi:hypothetical protein
VSVHRQRAGKGWSYWQGSPSDIADLGRVATELVGERDDRELKITLRGTRWQYESPTVEEQGS